MYTFSGSNPTQLYMDILSTVIKEGDVLAPRGKRIKEIRPVMIEFKNPIRRTTFLKGRNINPFFQVAESLWILAGRSDVGFLLDYNKNMGQFSDDGVFFNAPYGERLRFWNRSDANNFIYNPLDQLRDVYEKIKADPDTRQAVAVIYNPLFDNINNDTKDRPCNLLLSFKLRNGKLDLSVYNRSNDLHWGTFGANLCQFSTILEAMATWLGVEVGSYYQITDSLHVYLDDYGAKITEDIQKVYGVNLETDEAPVVEDFEELLDPNPRMSYTMNELNQFLNEYFGIVDSLMRDDETYMHDGDSAQMLLNQIRHVPDEYIKVTLLLMVAKQALNRGMKDTVATAMNWIPLCEVKVSALRFLYKSYPEYINQYDLDEKLMKYIRREE
ncbi:gp29 [Bacillus phage SPO1]|uniref:Thymidylate synthase n=1 Tax=Bacillus phage CampHawk TaxID=1406783 RepID=U5PTG2_9CAUD|nr:thymidylate synthase [Bacillus phage SPO1]YP_008770072.1 thymidylate synthase [Bacillus phage CampHawk]ACI91041.1 gp29 [Bacillus phage SPO1]AGY47016.1 thymidylate synthase [Bacillus phage CampHawk]UNY49091.1 thymidylate synthase [Bacillus phage SP82G]